jgi:hypothetical protein
MNTNRALTALLLVSVLGGCGGSWWPFGGSSDESNRVPAGASEFVCAQGKRLYVRLPEEGRSAWVILPEREFRLERASDGRYSSASTTLSLQGDAASLDIDGQRQYADCKRKAN